MPIVSLAAPGHPCLAALVRTLAEARAGDPLASATVVVPGALARVHVRRALGRLGGVVAVDVVTLVELAERLAGTARATAPLPPGGWEEAVRVALAADPGPFGAVAHHPATVQRLAVALRRLRPASTSERAAVAAQSGPGRRGHHLVQLLEAVEASTAGHHDRGGAGPGACAALARGVDPGPVVAFCPSGAEPGQLALLTALAAVDRLHVVAAITGEAAADEPVGALVEGLDGSTAWPPGPYLPPEPAPFPPDINDATGPASSVVPDHLVLAADAEAEARLVVQHVVAGLEEGTAGHDICVVSFGGTVALDRLADLLDAAEVAWSGPGGHDLAAVPSGRALLSLLGLAVEGWSHDGVLAALGGAPLRRGPDRPEPLPLGRWAALARQANVVGGQAQWRERPAALAGRCRRRGDDVTAAELDDMGEFIDGLARLLNPPAERTWVALSEWALGVVDTLLDPVVGGWPPAEVAAHAQVRAVVAQLRALDDVARSPGGAPGAVELLHALALRLSSTRSARRGRVGTGVLVVTDPADLVGVTPALLLLAGVVEGAVPARRADDPLIPDAELGLVAGAPGRAVRRASERAAAWAAVASAGRTVAFAHRADAQASRRPSRWFLQWAGALAGAPAPLGADDLEHADGPWLTLVPSFTATVCGPVAASIQERRLAGLAATAHRGRLELGSAPLVADHPGLARAVAASLARRSADFTAWDGLLGRRLALDAEVSASALEDWAVCPQRYLLRHRFGVGATLPPGDALAVDGADRGSLAHQVLAAVVQRGIGRPASDPWDDGDRTFLIGELRRRSADLRREGRLGVGVLAELRIDELQAVLLAALDHDDAVRAEEGWVPAGVEVSFGERAGRLVAVSLPSGRTVRFGGRIDRVDTDGAGRTRVVDYKTGRGQQYRDAAAGGAAAARLFQLAVYEAAARAAQPGTAVSSGWWLLEVAAADGNPLPIVPNRLHADAFAEALEAITDGIEAGVFPADPGEDGYRGPENCRFCPYDRVCRVDRVRSLQRVAGDPALAPWRALRAVGESLA